jgi:hypothetical protein
MPASIFCAPQHGVGDSLHFPVALFYDIVWIFGLTLSYINTGVCIGAANGCGIGTAFVYGDLFRQTMQVDSPLLVAPCFGQVPLGGEQQITVWPLSSTARYKYFDWPATLMYVSPIRQLVHTGRLRRRKMSAMIGGIFKAYRSPVEWSTQTSRSCIISSKRRKLNR